MQLCNLKSGLVGQLLGDVNEEYNSLNDEVKLFIDCRLSAPLLLEELSLLSSVLKVTVEHERIALS